ncbi:SDR family oxidoreductase [Neobacillus massiliamazoniensis]|uniref:Saccharopine dehydrogenase n=1 Tax=Neobacillus massiliamazoniensis TaxID=1499688 RepID=A0A0U1P4T6_9BACI|nr:SDR family oxidoreductase [Neobacillus massiliamazoniensis]CRK85208.1 saccharopine dehydrogenase [Neobacillus massiliamazoniensis]
MNKNTHVIFGTGPLGMALLRELKLRGVQDIRMVNRSGQLPGDDKVQVIRGDASQGSDAIEICKDASVVYHCAQPGYLNWPKQFPALTKGILEGAAAANAKLIYADNLYMYGRVNTPLKESLPYRAEGEKGKTRARMAEELMNAHKIGKVRVAIGRASDFYGPGVLKQSFMGERVFGFALSGKSVDVLGNVDVPHTYTYIDDFARGLATLGQEDRALGEVWHIPSADTITTRQLLQLLFDELGSDCKVRTSSRGVVSILSLFHPMMKEIKEIFYEFERPFVVDHIKFVREFGDHATTPHKEAVRHTVSWYRNILAKKNGKQ